jgi:geranylgeranyl pyrophosphate synthase
MTFNLSTWSTPRVEAIEAALAEMFSGVAPDRFRDACRYPLQTGGKRIRPLLTLAACEAVGGDWRAAIPAAVALELVHTYSLVHDDLPCMDDDDERRGKPTVHVAFGENTAVLVGDALLTESFAVLTRGGYAVPLCVRLVSELAQAAGGHGMIGGQVIDIGLGGPIEELAALLHLHRLKTGALLRAAVRMGGMVGAPDEHSHTPTLDTYGDAIGLAFQIHDDVLDADQDARADGPPSFVKLLGVERTATAARVECDRAIRAVESLPSAEALRALARYAVERSF